MAQILFALASSDLGISSLTYNLILFGAAFIVLVMPLFFVLRAQGGNSKSAF